MTSLKATGLADILSLVPALIGYRPEGRLVLVAIADGQVQAGLSVEIGDGPLQDRVDFAIEKVMGVGISAGIFALYRDRTSGGADLDGATDIIREAAAKRDFTVKEIATVSSTDWFDHEDIGTPRSLDEIQYSALAAGMVHAGLPVEPREFSIPEPDLATTTVSLAAMNLAVSIPVGPGLQGSPESLTAARNAYALWSMLATGDESATLTSSEAGRLIGYLQRSLCRDAISSWLGDPHDLDAEGIAAALGQIVTAGRPDQLPRVFRMQQVLLEVLRWTEEELRPNVLTLLGLCEWILGHGSTATKYFAAAQAILPDHRLAGLLTELTHRGILSPAASHPESRQYMFGRSN